MGKKSTKLTTPFADVVPPLSKEEFANLKRTLEADGGALNPVWITESNEVLDGHHRLKILGEAACDLLTIEGSGEWTTEHKAAWIIGRNRAQRNMSPAQDKELEKDSKRLAKELKTQGQTQAEIAKVFGVTQVRVHQWLSTPKKGTSNITPPYNTCIPQLDVRVKVPPAAFPAIVERVDAGESQTKVAADYKVSQQRINQIYNKETKLATAKKARTKAVKSLGKDTLNIHHGDFRKIGSLVADASVDMIFTDPPYNKDSVPLYADLAAFAKRVLKPGAWCLAYTGQTFLPAVLNGMAKHLTYAWCFGIGHAGGDLRIRKLKLQNKWKPVLGFYKPALDVWWDWFPDFATGGKEKDQHEWQQAEAEAVHFIRALAPEGGVVCDPFSGGGTTCAAAKSIGMQWVAFDIDKESVEKGRVRVNDK